MKRVDRFYFRFQPRKRSFLSLFFSFKLAKNFDLQAPVGVCSTGSRRQRSVSAALNDGALEPFILVDVSVK